MWDRIKKEVGNAVKKPMGFAVNPLLAQAGMANNIANPRPKSSTKGGVSEAQLNAAGEKGLQLGQLITGQDLGTSGKQIQDLLQKQLGLVGSDNPITGLMTQQRNAQIAQTGANMAKAGVRGGAAEAAKLQAGRAMDKQIAGQAYQQYQQNLQGAKDFVSGIQRQQLQPKYVEQQLAVAANQPVFQGQAGGGLLSGLFEGLFG